MTREEYAAELQRLSPAEVPDYLSRRSNLPGPRANLTLLDVAADVLPDELALGLATSDDEFLACCGVATLGRLILDGDSTLIAMLTRAAADPRWRVCEAAAIAGQRVGDAEPALVRRLVQDWTSSSDPLVVRCGIATICEPRLLTTSVMTAAALAACRQATDALLAVPADRRRDPAVRTLRQALGYCWSVAIASDPDSGLAAFRSPDGDDPDVAWVVRENLKKRRLAAIPVGGRS